MTKNQLEQLATEYVLTSPGNRVQAEKALREDLAGMQMYDAPIFGYASADDPYFARLKNHPQANVPLRLPGDWLAEAKTVISYFVPMTETVRVSNREDKKSPSCAWLHARIDGQIFLFMLGRHLVEVLQKAGYQAVQPSADERFYSVQAKPSEEGLTFTSNWSERHVAYGCGLGTFSLSKGLITAKGVAGRFGSLVTDWQAEPSPKYKTLTANCTMCGACVDNCPVQAISLEQGKDHEKCGRFLNAVLKKQAPYYGCGKCQVGVPCESCIP